MLLKKKKKKHANSKNSFPDGLVDSVQILYFSGRRNVSWRFARFPWPLPPLRPAWKTLQNWRCSSNIAGVLFFPLEELALVFFFFLCLFWWTKNFFLKQPTPESGEDLHFGSWDDPPLWFLTTQHRSVTTIALPMVDHVGSPGPQRLEAAVRLQPGPGSWKASTTPWTTGSTRTWGCQKPGEDRQL